MLNFSVEVIILLVHDWNRIFPPEVCVIAFIIALRAVLSETSVLIIELLIATCHVFWRMAPLMLPFSHQSYPRRTLEGATSLYSMEAIIITERHSN